MDDIEARRREAETPVSKLRNMLSPFVNLVAVLNHENYRNATYPGLLGACRSTELKLHLDAVESQLSTARQQLEEAKEILVSVQKAYNNAPSGWQPTEELNLAMVLIHVALYGNTDENKEP